MLTSNCRASAYRFFHSVRSSPSAAGRTSRAGIDSAVAWRFTARASAAPSARAGDPAWLAMLRQPYPDHSDEACLAANACDDATSTSCRGPVRGAEAEVRRVRAERRHFLDRLDSPESWPPAEIGGG